MVDDLKNLEKVVEPTKLPEEAIPSSLTTSLSEEDKEAQVFMLSYRYYDDGECGLDSLQSGSYKKALKNLRIIGGLSDKADFPRNNIKAKPVKCLGEYSKLYKRVPEATDVFESPLVDPNRLFFFISGSIFNIVAITAKHYEVGSVRR